MYTLLVILIVIAALLMIGIVLIQESKGGGLASQFSGYNQIGGVRKTTDFIEKAADVTRDNNVTVKDAVGVVNMILKK